MNRLGKSLLSCLAVITVVLSLLIIDPSGAQTIPKPCVPEFSLQYVDESYAVPANYSYEINPYNGEQIKTGHGEYHVDNETIEVTIKNQQVNSYIDPNTQVDYLLCYNISYKGHFEDKWQYYGLYSDGYTDISGFIDYGHKASESDTTTFLFGVGTDRSSTADMPNLGEVPKNSQIDFRVQALFGYYTGEMVNWVPGWRPSYGWRFTGQSSDWSNIQTLNLSDGSVNASSNPSPSVPEFPLITLLSLFVVVPLIAFFSVKKSKCKKH
jgi:hypothetical protein